MYVDSIYIFIIIGSVWKVLHQKWNEKQNWENFQFWISFAKLEIFVPALCSHSRHAGKDLNITSPHIRHIFKIMAFFKICTHDIYHYFKYVWHFFNMQCGYIQACLPCLKIAATHFGCSISWSCTISYLLDSSWSRIQNWTKTKLYGTIEDILTEYIFEQMWINSSGANKLWHKVCQMTTN